MAYSTHIVHRARQRLEQARADKQSLIRERLNTVYRQIPRVQQIDRQLRQSMVLATQAVFSGDAGANAAFEQVKQENQELQRERRELIEAQFGADYLDERPVCVHCGGTGYIGSTMCSCLQELCRQEQKQELTLLHCGEGSFEDFDLNFYPERPLPGSTVCIRKVMEKTYIDCKNYAQGFTARSDSLLFSGDTGLGKTFLSACIARQVAERGYSVVYESAVHLFEKLEKAKFGSEPDAVAEAEKFSGCDLLIVDDLGTELAGQFVTAALYTLVNDRLLEGRPTIISTNLTIEEMGKRYSPQILSRLRGSYRRVAFVGDDIRMLKKRGIGL